MAACIPDTMPPSAPIKQENGNSELGQVDINNSIVNDTIENEYVSQHKNFVQPENDAISRTNMALNWSPSAAMFQQPTKIADIVPVASTCAACHKPIYSRYLLAVSGVHYHEACLRCSSCQLPLIEVGSKCYRNRSGAILCEKDYALLKQQQSYVNNRNSVILDSSTFNSSCSGCHLPLRPTDWVTVVHDKKYHAECFSCCSCHQRLMKGSNFVLADNQIWCEKDFHQIRPNGMPISVAQSQIHRNNMIFQNSQF